MSFVTPPQRDALTPDEVLAAANQMVTPFGDYMGASLREGFGQSGVGLLYDRMTMPAPVETESQPELNARLNLPGPRPDPAQKALGEDEWKASTDFRPGLPFEAGMTEARAAARADDFDNSAWRQNLYAKYEGGLAGKAAGIAAQFAGGAPSPENFIPFLGPEIRAGMMLRLGRVGGSAVTAATEGLLGTAVTEPFIAQHQIERGQDYGLADVTADLLLGTAAGGAFGALHGAAGALLERRRASVAPEAAPVVGEAVAGAETHDIPPVEPLQPEAATVAPATEKPPQTVIDEPQFASFAESGGDNAAAPEGAAPAVRVQGEVFTGETHADAAHAAVLEHGAAAVKEMEENPDAALGYLTRSPRPAGDVLTPPVLARETDALNAAADALARDEPVDVGAMVPERAAGPYIDVFHGTPHEFSEFDAGKIGTGEGAQAYGHGLYFAESKDIAGHYRKKLSESEIVGLDPKAYDMSPAEAHLAARQWLGSPRSDLLDQRAEHPATGGQRLLNDIIDGKVRLEGGNLLGVRLHVDPEHLLDWDKPLSEQSPYVLQKLAQAFPNVIGHDERTGKILYRGSSAEGWTGMSINAALTNEFGSEQAAARALHEAGIPGLRYLDASSRTAGEGSRNIVLFDPSRAEITHVNNRAVERPIPPHPSVAEAAPRVGKAGDELKTFAEDAGLTQHVAEAPPVQTAEQKQVAKAKEVEKAAKGTPAEPEPPGPLEADIQALRDAGRITPEMEAMLSEAADDAKTAEGYATSYEALSTCVTRFA